MHSREMMAKIVDAMSAPMHKMLHEQFLKDKDKLPPDFEERTAKMIDDGMKSFPWDEMLDSMVPVYQKHFTKGDVSVLIAFYGTPTGQKLLREMPAIMQEAMESMMPLMQKNGSHERPSPAGSRANDEGLQACAETKVRRDQELVFVPLKVSCE
ncbi:MAG TPA: DUF2059 domain-containing protein [Candidatus Acidoferrum sp.]|nr:DUF2059 domain-containing protein [Candidatus Acidoferrum sp.]